jgi:hypothetical protein
MSNIVIVARQFRGSRIYLTSFKGPTEFVWSADRAKALPVSVDAAKRIVTSAQAYEADAYAIDAKGNVIVPAASGAAVPLGPTEESPRPAKAVPRVLGNLAARNARCADCGKRGVLIGHEGCATPGRYEQLAKIGAGLAAEEES